MASSKLALYKLFGWYDASAINLSDAEKSSFSPNGSGKASPFLSDAMRQFYGSFTTPSQDPSIKSREMQEMGQYELVFPILEVYTEEATNPDFEKEKSLWFTCSDSSVETELNEMLQEIDAEEAIAQAVYSLACDGNQFRRLHISEKGVVGFISVPRDNISRVYDPLSRRLIGFEWKGVEPPPESTVEFDGRKLFAPWEFIHFRRLVSSNPTSDPEYGNGLLENLYPLYRRIKMSVDHMVVYRANIMPNRLKVELDTGVKTPIEMAEYMNEYRNLFFGLLAENPATNQFENRYNPPAMDSILFVPKARDDKTTIDTLEGQDNVPDVYDIETLLKMFHGGSRVPRAYLGFEEDNNGLSSSSLVTKDLRFARAVRNLRRPIIRGFKRLADIHLASTGRDPKNYKVEVHMSRICMLEEEISARIMTDQVAVASSIVDLLQKVGVGNQAMLDIIFKNMLTSLSSHADVAKLSAAVTAATKGGSGSEMGDELGFESVQAQTLWPQIKNALHQLTESKNKKLLGEDLEKAHMLIEQKAQKLQELLKHRKISLVEGYQASEPGDLPPIAKVTGNNLVESDGKGSGSQTSQAGHPQVTLRARMRKAAASTD